MPIINRRKWEKNVNIAKVMTQLELLTKHVMESHSKAVNVVTSNSVQAYDD